MPAADIREYEAGANSTDVFGRVLCTARNHHFIVDGPLQNGCPGEEVTPAEIFLAGVAACGVELPAEMPWARHVYHVYTLRTEDRDALQATLYAEGIQTAVHYALPVHLQPAYDDLGYSRGAFPQAEKAAEEVLSLPLYPEITDAQIQKVTQALTIVAPAQ